MSTQSQAGTKLHYAWVVALVTFVVMLITAGVRATPGLFMVPLEAEFGWSRTTISAAIAVNIALFGLIGPFAASVMDRWGLRRVVIAALALMAASVAVSTRMPPNGSSSCCGASLVGAGTGVTAMVLAAVVATRWFDERRGLVMGMLSAANATGQLVFLPMLAARRRTVELAIGGADRRRGRGGGLRARVAVHARSARRHRSRAVRPARGRAAGRGRGADGAARGARRRVTLARLLDARRHVLHLRREHQRPDRHAPDLGVPRRRHSGDALDAAAGADGHLRHPRHDGVGLADRSLLARDTCCSAYYSLRGLSLLFLPATLLEGGAGLGIFAVFYGLDWIATVPPTVKLTTEAFGRENTGVIYGWIGASHQLGASMAAFGAGAIRTELGDYRLAFLIAGVLCLIAGASFLVVGRLMSTQSVSRPVAPAAAGASLR